MVKNALVATVLVLFGSASLACAAEKDDIQAAVKKLSDSGYSWKQTSEGGGGGGGGGQARGGGTVEGKFQADGLTWVSRTGGNNTTVFIIKGDKGAIKAGDADWVSLDDAQNDQNNQAAQRAARGAKALKVPTVQASTLVESVKDFSKADDAYSADLSEDAIKQLMTFGGGRRGGANGNANANAPQISNAKGTVKVWINDGALTKIVYNVQGTISFNGQDRDINRTTTIEFSEVGTTKIDVPADAKQKAGLT
jgi:hypothetical protein